MKSKRGQRHPRKIAAVALSVSMLGFAGSEIAANTAKPWYTSIKPLTIQGGAGDNGTKTGAGNDPSRTPGTADAAPEKSGVKEPDPDTPADRAAKTNAGGAGDTSSKDPRPNVGEDRSGTAASAPTGEDELSALKLPGEQARSAPVRARKAVPAVTDDAVRSGVARKKPVTVKHKKLSAVQPRETPADETRNARRTGLFAGKKAASVLRSGDFTGKKKAADRPWYSSFWPLGKPVEVATLNDAYIPFKTEKGAKPKHANKTNKSGKVDLAAARLPGRPPLLYEMGNGFLDTGKLDEGFEIPVIGAVWQPRLWVYLINRTAFQTYDDGRSGRRRETELANRLDIFANLQLTGTEKILIGLRPLDNNRPNRFTRYTFAGADKGFNNELSIGLETLFFEGDLGSLFPALDRGGFLPLDFGFTVGRQPFVFQEGILINDTVDAVGFVRNNIPFPGMSNLRISGMWGWNRLDRNDRPGADENMFGLFLAADSHISTYNLDLIYVNDGGGRSDGFYAGASTIQRLAAFGGISTALRINGSFALEDEIPGNVVGNGVLLTAEISRTVKGSDDIVYFNPFLGIGNYTQAGREAIVGGPLANTGILFASPSLSTFLSEIDPFIGDDVIGAALGYQAFWDNKRRNLILEIAGRHDLGGKGIDSLGVGFQLQQAVGQHVQLTLESFYTINGGRDDGAGARAEVQVVY